MICEHGCAFHPRSGAASPFCGPFAPPMIGATKAISSRRPYKKENGTVFDSKTASWAQSCSQPPIEYGVPFSGPRALNERGDPRRRLLALMIQQQERLIPEGRGDDLGPVSVPAAVAWMGPLDDRPELSATIGANGFARSVVGYDLPAAWRKHLWQGWSPQDYRHLVGVVPIDPSAENIGLLPTLDFEPIAQRTGHAGNRVGIRVLVDFGAPRLRRDRIGPRPPPNQHLVVDDRVNPDQSHRTGISLDANAIIEILRTADIPA